MILFFDTETTGLTDSYNHYSAEHQPHLVQLACILTEDTGEEVGVLKACIKPNNWTVGDKTAEITGLSTEYATLHGVDLTCLLSLFKQWATLANKLVAYNCSFDKCILQKAYHYIGRDSVGSILFDNKLECAMAPMTHICKLPSKPGSKSEFKWPKLIEAYRHCFGKDFDKAHDALADVRATKEIYFWLKQQKEVI